MIASELGVSKDVIKYHKKSISEAEIGWDEGQVIISPAGVDYIKSRLKKENYNENFEKYTRSKLKNIEGRLELIDEFLVKKLVLDKKVESIPEQETSPVLKNEVDLLTELYELLNDDFKKWYCEKNKYPNWEDWHLGFVKLVEVTAYLQQK